MVSIILIFPLLPKQNSHKITNLNFIFMFFKHLVSIRNPYEKEKRLCILCKMNIVPDYKNTRMLSQFISRFTGRIYGRHITGLCRHKQELVEKEIKKSREAG